MRGYAIIFGITFCINGYNQNLIAPPDHTLLEIPPNPLQSVESQQKVELGEPIEEDINNAETRLFTESDDDVINQQTADLSDYALEYGNITFSPFATDKFPTSFNDYLDYPIQPDGNDESDVQQTSDLSVSTAHKIPKPTIQNPGLDNIGMPKDGKNHPCYRPCKLLDRRTCYYQFKVEWYHAMSKACMDCPRNATHCNNPDCVPANGVGRTITVVNRKMPGPSIEVCVGDKVVVDVTNALHAAGTTIHWHGMHQKATPYMDGAPYVTQCPIQPQSTFRYEFHVPISGTYFWHSHIGLQRGDGTTGSLIIRKPKNLSLNGRLYDYDKSEHVMLITDWINNSAINLYTNHHHSTDDNQPNRPGSILINGRGRFDVPVGNTTVRMKAPEFLVEKGRKYRFRLINGNFLNCPVELSVDGHNITVIATDGFDITPITASVLVNYAGERFDFVINANKRVDVYWIRVRGLLPCAAAGIRQVAILRYKGAKAEEPALDWSSPRSGLVLNQVQQGEEQNVTLPISRFRSQNADDLTSKPIADHKFYIGYDMNLKNNTDFHRVPYYGTDKVASNYWVFTPQLNHISMELPKSPLLVTRPTSGLCNELTVPASCKTEFCQCPHVINVKLNSVVEIIIIDEGTLDVNHPFHLHGHSFRVIGQRRLGTSTSVAAVKALDAAGMVERNLRKAPIKDTVTTPDGGYTIIRFLADNPGYWLFHCHIEFHADIGMAMVVKVGEHRNMRPVPKGFPQCGDFKQTDYNIV